MEVEAGSLSRLKPSINGSIRYKRALKICLVSCSILLLMAGFYFLCTPGAGCDLPQKDYCTVVVDCGSTGTRVNVYMWERSSSGNLSLPVLLHSYPGNSTDTMSTVSKSSCNYHCMQTVPDLDKFVGNATGVRLSLEHLISLVEWWVPREKHGDTPIFVLATAGLRSVQVADAKRILDDVEDGLQKHSFVYRKLDKGLECGKKEFGQQLGARGYVSTHLVGDPNWEQCKGIAQAAAMNSTGVDCSPATVTTDCKARLSSDTGTKDYSYILNVSIDVHQTVRFHALSGFFSVYIMLKLPLVANLTRIEQVIEQLCSESRADMSSGSGNENSLGYYCFRVPYMLSLINHALCLGDKEIVFGPGDLSWTLGAALVEGDYLWLCDTRSNFLPLKNVDVVFSPIFVFSVLLCLLFVVYHSQIKLPMLGRKGPVGASLPSYFHPKSRPN